MSELAPQVRADLYRTVRLIRRFEERSIDLVKAGEIESGIHPCIGQEASAAGVCAAHGVRVGCFRPPSVPEGRSCLRFTGRADLSADDLAQVAVALRVCWQALGGCTR